ncbi:helix-turn-helix transcriptional regulator [Halopelagius longus]|uniref:IclR-like transcriptional regulator n=1 Tax=Halopelagius longus TaxID=1236180 RepID=A0A1H1GHI4_9EURY|nr:IclR-like transcriptional regulator [Halopelagius longus]RDI69739.1 IclR-like transcriptional regulator [Halopelagius longus]SDR12627.1 hypothetical protein SAMN05216278_3674 [Halopelagius longus]
MTHTILRFVFACAVLIAGITGAFVGPAAGAAAEGTVTVTNGTVATADGTAYVWRTSATDVRVETTNPIPSSSSICIAPTGQNTTAVKCVPGDGTDNVTLSVQSWSTDASGTYTVYEKTENGRNVIEREAIHVMSQSGDIDNDGLSNADEVSGDTQFRTADTDGDGLNDGKEVNTHGTSPTESDTDGDGLSDSMEVNTYDTNPTKPDTDGDGINDGKEVNQHETDPTKADTDGDGLDDTPELQTYGTNPNKPDTDGDGLEDGAEINQYETDPNDPDSDKDGLDDASEVKEHQTNPNKADTDKDGLDDASEVNVHGTDPNDPDTDDDGRDDQLEVEEGTDPVESSRAANIPDEAIAGAGVVLAAIAIGGYYWRRRGGATLPEDDGDDDDRHADVTATPPVEEDPDVENAGWMETPAKRTFGADAGGETGDGESRVPRPLTREDEVVMLLEEAGGQMEQSEIVEHTDWSKATVSRVLSSMADDDRITKISLGRRNLITLPGEEPEGAKSPFEREA